MVRLTTGQQISLSLLLSWIQKGGFAVLDQGLFAGSNFLVNILLARWLEPAEYGAFTVAYSIFLLLTTFHTAVLTEPMLVFGTGKYGEQFPRYMGLLIYGHWGVTGIIALILALAALVFWQLGLDHLAQTLAGLAIASPLILLLWLVRRAFYVHGQPQWSATGGMLYLALMLTGMYGLYRTQRLSATFALVIMGLASLAVSLWFSKLLRPRWRLRGSHPPSRMVLADHWRYGRWAAAAAALTWVPSSIYYTLLPAWVGLEGSAALRAVMNLLMPIFQGNAAISVLLVPLFIRALKVEGHAGFSRLVCLSFIFFAVGSICYWGLLLFCHNQVFLWVYGGRYAEHTDLLIPAGLLLLPTGVTTVLGSALRALERPDQIFWCHAGATLMAITIGLWLLAAHGVAGAIEGSLASSVTAAAIMTGIYGRSRY